MFCFDPEPLEANFCSLQTDTEFHRDFGRILHLGGVFVVDQKRRSKYLCLMLGGFISGYFGKFGRARSAD